MSEIRAWNEYRVAAEDFLERPSIQAEARAIATYAEFARAFAPEHADELITLFCRHIADI